MKKGDQVCTPRFLNVEITEVFKSGKEARENGFTEPTYYRSDDYDVLGKNIDCLHMVFAAVEKRRIRDER